MALSRKAREDALDELDRAALEIEKSGYRGLADRVDECHEALYVFGPEAEDKVREELVKIDAAFERMESRKSSRKAAERRPVARRRPLEGWDKGDADASYKEHRREKGMPDIGKGNKSASLREARMARLGFSERDVKKARHLALDRFLS